MKRSTPIPAILALLVTSPCNTAAAQGPRAAGQTFVYEITVSHNIKADFSSLPASMQGQVAAQEARGNKTPIVYVLTATADHVNPDGSAHAHVGFTNSLEGNLRGADQSVFARFNQFGAAFGADGRLIPQYDPKMPPATDSRGMTPEQIQNTKAGQMSDILADFNIFAAGCAKRGQIRIGDAWHVASRDQYGMSRTYDFAATAIMGSVAAVTLKGAFASSTGTNSVDAAGSYDIARHLIVDLHVVESFKNVPAGGPSSSGTTTTDYRLKE
ncbi:MAG: hypothetical protein JO311_00050 [Candidatus Eremiobacteraeota bacterium]|nr:hypothetical protein [Candidatus Eremiobacteraeota bacterium]MBV9262873.1 hypothetical protein [Candidatus Eremiobacteraeota bacterium]